LTSKNLIVKDVSSNMTGLIYNSFHWGSEYSSL